MTFFHYGFDTELIFSYNEPCSGILSQVEVTEIDRRLLSIMYTIRWTVNKTNPIPPRVAMKMKILSLFSEIFGKMFDEKFFFILNGLEDSFHRMISSAVVVPFQVKTLYIFHLKAFIY